MLLSIKVGTRSSSLSRAQVDEVLKEIQRTAPSVVFDPVWMATTGDQDKHTSLRALEKSDFFTRELDALQLSLGCRITIHSAKDLPEPLPEGLVIAAITRGVDPSDVVVFRDNEHLGALEQGARIGTSSMRREEMVLKLRSDLICVDIRGTIEERLALLDQHHIDGVVMAEAALIRLRKTTRSRVILPGPSAPLQGQLAVIALSDDDEMRALFAAIDSRPK